MRQNVFRSAWKVAAASMVVTGALCGQALAINDVISKWTFESAAPSGSSTTFGPLNNEAGTVLTGTALGVHATASTWSSPAGNGSGKSFSVTNWAAGDYWQFATDTTGMSNIGFQVDQVSSTTGPGNWKFQYSLNGTTFTDFATYTIQPNVVQAAWSSAGPVAPLGLDTYDFNLSSITGLNNNPLAAFRLVAASPLVAAQLGSTPAATGTSRVDNVSIVGNFDASNYDAVTGLVPPAPAAPVLPVTGDIAFGMGSGRNKITLQLIRGAAAPLGGVKTAPYSAWTQTNFERFMKFDNTGSSNSHNVHGNLLGVDPGGSAAAGGKIYSFGTQGANPQPAGQLLATTGTGNGVSRLGGLSVAPDNSKIAVAAFDTGKVMVFDYTPGNTLGTGSPALTGRRESTNVILGTGANFTAGSQQGTAWLDSSTVLAFNGTTGQLYTVDSTSMAETLKQTVVLPGTSQISTALAYNPNLSPYIYAMYSGFSTGIGTNKLYVFDPSAAYADLTAGGIDFSTSAQSVRDIALGTGGNLFITTNGGAQTIEYIPGVTTPGSITANSSVDYYVDENIAPNANFSGLDIGLAPPGIAGDYNSDGKVDAGDYATWRKNTGNLALANDNGVGNQAARFALWRANFGKPPGAGSGLGRASVPEPTSAVLFAIGLVAFCSRRRSA